MEVSIFLECVIIILMIKGLNSGLASQKINRAPSAAPIRNGRGGSKLQNQFYCIKKGGVHKGDFLKGSGEDQKLLLMEGTEEKGPWYNDWPSDFSEKMIKKCIDEGWVVFMDRMVG